MNRGDYISKQEAILLQGIGAMFMVYHHLFGFPERIAAPYVIVSDFGFLHIGTMLSYFGRICISIFAFVSGYGMCKMGYQRLLGKPNVLLNGYKMVLTQLKKFYSRFWLVCLVFIPIGYLMKIYSFEPWILVKSLLGLSNAYNKEWWYAGTYIRFLLYFPILFFAISLIEHLDKRKSTIILAVIGISGTLGYLLFGWAEKWSVSFCFFSGMLVIALGLFERAGAWLDILGKWKYAIAFSGAGGVSLTRFVFEHNCDEDFLFTPLFLFFILVLLKSDFCKRTFNKAIAFVGRYSTYVWLTHTFFGYYYFQRLTFAPYYSTLIFIWCLLLCVSTGFIAERVLSFMKRKIERL